MSLLTLTHFLLRSVWATLPSLTRVLFHHVLFLFEVLRAVASVLYIEHVCESVCVCVCVCVCHEGWGGLSLLEYYFIFVYTHCCVMLCVPFLSFIFSFSLSITLSGCCYRTVYCCYSCCHFQKEEVLLL